LNVLPSPLPAAVVRRRNSRVVRDHNGQALVYVYFEDEPGRRSAAKLLEAGRGETDRGKYRETVEPPSDVGVR